MSSGTNNDPRKAKSGIGKVPSQGSTSAPVMKGKLGLDSASGNPPGDDAVPSDNNFKVYVKVKPPPKGLKLVPSQVKLFQVANPAIIVDLSDAHQDKTKNVDVVGKRFQYHGAFSAKATQQEVFEQVVKPHVVDLLAGKNATVMAYGSRNSGKTYTLEGSSNDPGSILRTLAMIVEQEEIAGTPNYKPISYKKIKPLDDERRNSEREIKDQVFSPLDDAHVKSFSKVLKAMEEEWTFPMGVKSGPQCEIWLSYLEIRNEKYYDLLSLDYHTHQSPLLFTKDSRGQIFVNDLTQLHVKSVADARNVLTIGRYNLQRISSRLNLKPWKSHCILTITLLRYKELNQPKKVQMSRLSFCDLAAHDECFTLDMSLLALLKSLRNYYDTRLHPVPKPTEEFTFSKLTCLFKKSLTGASSFSFITHVNPDPGMYKNSHTSLHFTALRTEILTKVRNIRPSQYLNSVRKMTLESVEDITECENLTGEQAMDLITTFKDDLSAYSRINLKTRTEINKIILQHYTLMLCKMEQCILKQQELLSNRGDDPHERQMRQFALDQMKTILECLQEGNTATKLELDNDEIEFEKVGRLPAELRIKIPEEVDPAVILLKAARVRKQEDKKIEDLRKLLNESKDQLSLALHNNSEAEARLGTVERRYVALKVKNDMDGMLNQHTRTILNEQDETLTRYRLLWEQYNAYKEKEISEIEPKMSFEDWLETENLRKVDAEFDANADNPTVVHGEGTVEEAWKSTLEQPDEGDDGIRSGNLRVDTPQNKSTNSTAIIEDLTVKQVDDCADEMHLNIMRELKAEFDVSKSPMRTSDSEKVATDVSDAIADKPTGDPGTSKSFEAPGPSSMDIPSAGELMMFGTEVEPTPGVSTPYQSLTPGTSKSIKTEVINLHATKDSLENVELKMETLEELKETPATLVAEDLSKGLQDAKNQAENLEEVNPSDPPPADDSTNDTTPSHKSGTYHSTTDMESSEDAEGSDDTYMPRRQSKRIKLANEKQGRTKRTAESLEISDNETASTSSSQNCAMGDDDAPGTSLRRSRRQKNNTQRHVSPEESLKSRRSKRLNPPTLCYKCNVTIFERSVYHCYVCQKKKNKMCLDCFKKYGHEHLMQLMTI
ncbi:kinesin-like protein KIF20A [Diachasmimorpha longicaudata]|uniref:kinesin-like protein KIF20A n=1 Tax=Diachasmimorpha longicaudata TaxID=58733 RepID=UPI0030B8DF87